MTLPNERYRAIKFAERFLEDLTNPRLTPRVPKHLRNTASRILRHFPSDWDLDRITAASPNIINSGRKLDPLYDMVKNYDQQKISGNTDSTSKNKDDDHAL